MKITFDENKSCEMILIILKFFLQHFLKIKSKLKKIVANYKNEKDKMKETSNKYHDGTKPTTSSYL